VIHRHGACDLKQFKYYHGADFFALSSILLRFQGDSVAMSVILMRESSESSNVLRWVQPSQLLTVSLPRLIQFAMQGGQGAGRWYSRQTFSETKYINLVPDIWFTTFSQRAARGDHLDSLYNALHQTCDEDFHTTVALWNSKMKQPVYTKIQCDKHFQPDIARS
jgi:hypothetical protein